MTLEELLRQGKSFGQGASNAAASTVTGPVDMLAWLLRKGGVPVGDTPIGGEAWMRQKGLMATPENRLAGLLGEGAGLAAPIVAAAKAPEIAGGLLQMGRNLAAPTPLNKQTGAIVYHGSPHKFDKFDSSKIGTGEGAQAYGHGLYLAESPDVAGQYAKNIMGPTATPENVALKVINAGNDPFQRLKQVFPKMTDTEVKAAVESAKGYLGNTYKVDLPDEHIAKMLDWDKPLSENEMIALYDKMQQTPQTGFAKAFQDNYYSRMERGVPATDGQDLFMELSKELGGQKQVSEYLKTIDVPGIKYFDQGSRIKGVAKPSGQVSTVTDAMNVAPPTQSRLSQNFVVFPGNEGLLKILERNGGKP